MITKHAKSKPVQIGEHLAKWCWGHKSYRVIDDFYAPDASECKRCKIKSVLQRRARRQLSAMTCADNKVFP